VINNNGIAIKINNAIVGRSMFKLFDINGKLIYEFKPLSNSFSIPHNKLGSSNGLLILRGSDGKTTQTEKLLLLKN
jgi:hypothetical protein